MTHAPSGENFMHRTSLAQATLLTVKAEIRRRLAAREHEQARYLIEGWRHRCARCEARQALLGDLLGAASVALEAASKGLPYSF